VYTCGMQKTSFLINKMDCPSEESLIRMKLDSIAAIKSMEFDIPKRMVYIYHDHGLSEIEKQLKELNLGSKRLQTEESSLVFSSQKEEHIKQRKSLYFVLAINFSFFLIEMFSGILSYSMGLIADSLDMLADSFVYILSLMAIGSPLIRKKRVAKLAGYFQMILAFIGFSEVIRRFIGSELFPHFKTMMIVSIFALLANLLSLYILQKSKSTEVHMQASMIFTSNDILINLGIILAGALVYIFHSPYPDLLIGTLVFILVIRGGLRILTLAK